LIRAFNELNTYMKKQRKSLKHFDVIQDFSDDEEDREMRRDGGETQKIVDD